MGEKQGKMVQEPEGNQSLHSRALVRSMSAWTLCTQVPRGHNGPE